MLFAFSIYALFHIGEHHVAIYSFNPILIYNLSAPLLLYIPLRVFFTGVWSCCIVMLSMLLLVLANQSKIDFIGSALSWGDLANMANLRIALRYASYIQWLLIISFALLVSVLLILKLRNIYQKRSSANIRHRAVKLTWLTLCYIFVVSFVLGPHYPVFAYEQLAKYNLPAPKYISWNWNRNAIENGLLLHLIQTSVRNTLAPPSTQDLSALERLPHQPFVQDSPEKVFFILCEACWYDEENFKEAFEPLLELGFTPMRSISPVYGGGTVNAAFEMLTGLPATGKLYGIIYQEYGELISGRAVTLASALAERGYSTYSLHNFARSFWKRDIVLPKFGFQEFLGIEQMQYVKSGPYARDRILYNETLKIIESGINDKLFFHLETVYTHGPYEQSEDWGGGDYVTKLEVSVQDLADFVKSVLDFSDDYLFVIYGDHKPALSDYFINNMVLPEEAFKNDGVLVNNALQARVGDVPILVLSNDIHKVASLSYTANNKPLFCLSAKVDDLFFGTNRPASRWSRRAICPHFQLSDYRFEDKDTPDWLYYITLFDKGGN